MTIVGRELVAPSEFGAVLSAPCGKFPLRFRRQILAGPFRISERVGIGDVYDRMTAERIDIALGPVGMAPIRALEQRPPLAPITQIDRMRWRRKDQRACEQHVRQCAGIIFRIGHDLRGCHVAGRANEFLEVTICYRIAVDPEVTDGDLMHRRFFRIMLV